MIRGAIVLLSLELSQAIARADAQSYTLKSFEGTKENITLSYKPGSEILTVSHSKDTLFIHDYWATDSVVILDEVFLQINYSNRMGSNEGSGRQLWLSISGGKLCQALCVESFFEFDMRPREYSLSKIRTTLSGYDANTYKLTLHIHDEHRSRQNKKLNWNHNKTTILSFDKRKRIFYSRYENGIALITIGSEKYYYFKENWCYKDNHMYYPYL
ncbi:MAG TPA: hypothetical protein VL978_17125 [Puia sp.]|nr:hypothetical protein [Puia sp.]